MIGTNWRETAGNVPEMLPELFEQETWEAPPPASARPALPNTGADKQKRGAPQNLCGTPIVLDGFRTGDYTLRRQHYAKLLALRLPAPVIVIRGHTDNQGDTVSNVGLSASRAFEVQQWLALRNGGKPIAKVVKIEGLGASAPVAANATESGRSRNRRVEIILCKTPPPPPQVANALQIQLGGPVVGETAAAAEFGEMQSEDSATKSWYYIYAQRWDGSQWNTVEPLQFWDTAANAARAYDGMCGKYQSSDPSTTVVVCLVFLPTSQRWVPCRNSVGFPGTFFCGRLERS